MTEQNFGFRLKWLGCACFEMDFGDGTVVSDPFITDNNKMDLTWESVEKCDYIAVSHIHYDHITDIPALVEKFHPYILSGEFSARDLIKWADLNPMMTYPMYPDQELDFDFFKVKALYGRHIMLGGFDFTASRHLKSSQNNPVYEGRMELLDLIPNGDFEYRNFLFTLPNGTTVLIWGNRLDRPDQRSILRQLKVDVAIMQITTNAAADTAAICKEMGCKVVIPHHFDYPGSAMKRVLATEEELKKQAPEIRFIIPEYDKWIDL